MTSEQIINKLPYKHPFLFVDEIIAVDDSSISGSYTYPENLFFYKGHFIDKPITPGVILTETMAQIGLVSFGIYLTRDSESAIENATIAMTSNAIDYFLPVLPSEKVIVKAQKEYFRFNKLKCKVEMYNENDQLVSRGQISGMITK